LPARSAWPALDLGHEFRLEDGEDVYGQGIWAHSFRYRDGTFFLYRKLPSQNETRSAALY